MKKPNQHVVPHKGKWGIKKENSTKITKTFENKTDAIERGKEIAKNQEVELIIHKKDGIIQNSNSYGNDPNPPKDKKP